MPAAYDVTRRETFESIEDIWMREVDMYSTVDDAVKIVVGNKVDKVRACTHCASQCRPQPQGILMDFIYLYLFIYQFINLFIFYYFLLKPNGLSVVSCQLSKTFTAASVYWRRRQTGR